MCLISATYSLNLHPADPLRQHPCAETRCYFVTNPYSVGFGKEQEPKLSDTLKLLQHMRSLKLLYKVDLSMAAYANTLLLPCKCLLSVSAEHLENLKYL